MCHQRKIPVCNKSQLINLLFINNSNSSNHPWTLHSWGYKINDHMLNLLTNSTISSNPYWINEECTHTHRLISIIFTLAAQHSYSSLKWGILHSSNRCLNNTVSRSNNYLTDLVHLWESMILQEWISKLKLLNLTYKQWIRMLWR